MDETDLPDNPGGAIIDPNEGKSLKELRLEQQTEILVKEVLEGEVADSFRGIRDTGLEALGVDVIKEVEGRVVADMGSGFGGLAKSASVEQVPTEIHSVNPKLAIKKFKEREEEAGVSALRRDYPDITDDQIAAAQQYHDSRLSTNFAHDLSDFSDAFFDLIIDNAAVSTYMPYGSTELYEKTIREMLRVLKPGGTILIRDNYKGAIGSRDITGEIGSKEKALQMIGCRYEPKKAENGVPVGAIIYKD